MQISEFEFLEFKVKFENKMNLWIILWFYSLQSIVCLAVLGVAAAGLIPAAPVAYVADHHGDHNGDYYVSL